MAPTETNNLQSKLDNKAEEAQSKTIQNQSTDPSTVEHFQQTVSKSTELIDPAMVEILRGAT
jgi:hypothetical protein